jgi:UDP-3-O-acyl-N-acetylglucosamine deacetylase
VKAEIHILDGAGIRFSFSLDDNGDSEDDDSDCWLAISLYLSIPEAPNWSIGHP